MLGTPKTRGKGVSTAYSRRSRLNKMNLNPNLSDAIIAIVTAVLSWLASKWHSKSKEK